MKYVYAYHVRTGQKRRIPEPWMKSNVFGANWKPTPSSRGKKPRRNPVETPEPVSTEAGSTHAPADGDTPRKDQ